jgi:predicted ester cyclase
VFVEEALSACPDLHMTIEDTVVEGDKVVSRVRMTGTHTGPMRGFAPTGRKIDAQYIAIEHYDGGRCVEEWACADDVGVARQIGALPPPGSLGERIVQRLFALRAARIRRGG